MTIQVQLTDTFEQWRQKTNQISVTASGFDSNITILQGNVATLTSNIATLTSNVTTLQSNVTSINSNLTLVYANIATLNNADNAIRTNVTLLQNSVVITGSNVELGNVSGRRVFVNGVNGWVGITTTNPRGNLEVKGNLVLSPLSGSNYVGLRAGSPSANVVYVLPNADGTSGQALTTSGTGTLSWTTIESGAAGAQTIVSIQASEAISAGNVVNIHSVSGAFRVRRANAAAQIEAHGFVIQGVSSGNSANVYLSGLNANVTALTPNVVYLATTAGSVTQTPPSGTNQLVQRLGVATSATSFIFNPQTPILLS